jgi:hypothetical protein
VKDNGVGAPLSVVCFKWKRGRKGYQLPSVCDYTAEHVNILSRMVDRHLDMPYRFICVTDDPKGLDDDIEVVPLWDKCLALGGCYNRLYAFSPDMMPLFGPRFVMIDLDCVVVGDITPLFDTPEPFVMNAYLGDMTRQFYNGALVLMDTGCRAEVWETFHPKHSPLMMKREKQAGRLIGSDQAWIAHTLGPDEATFGPWCGVYEALRVQDRLPLDARIVFFSGKRDPSERQYAWVREHYR